MAKISEETMEALRLETVHLLLAVRRAYLEAGASQIKHWEQIQTRIRAAARSTISAEEWVSALVRGLRLPRLSKDLSSRMTRLVDAVNAAGARGEWLDMVEREYGLLIAMTRMEADAARSRKRAAYGERREIEEEV